MRRPSTTLAHTADLTSDTEPAKAGGNPLEAEPLRAGRAARAIVSDGRAVHDAIEAVLAAPEESREIARRAYEVVRDQLVAGELDTIPVDRLRDLVRGRPVTFAPIRDAGLDTVGTVLTTSAKAQQQDPRERRRTAKRITAAARQMRDSVEEGIRVRIEPDARTPEQPALVAALRRYERTRSPK